MKTTPECSWCGTDDSGTETWTVNGRPCDLCFMCRIRAQFVDPEAHRVESGAASLHPTGEREDGD